jgi:hypothetical protein
MPPKASVGVVEMLAAGAGATPGRTKVRHSRDGFAAEPLGRKLRRIAGNNSA